MVNETLLQDLQTTAVKMRSAIGDLRQSRDRAKRIMRLALVGLVLDLCLSLGLAYNAVPTELALEEATRSNRAAFIICQETNNLRTAELDLWLPLLLKPLDPEAPPQTEEQKRSVAEFKASLEKNFAQKDCSALQSP